MRTRSWFAKFGCAVAALAVLYQHWLKQKSWSESERVARLQAGVIRHGLAWLQEEVAAKSRDDIATLVRQLGVFMIARSRSRSQQHGSQSRLPRRAMICEVRPLACCKLFLGDVVLFHTSSLLRGN